jgi:hypothetical protein
MSTRILHYPAIDSGLLVWTLTTKTMVSTFPCGPKDAGGLVSECRVSSPRSLARSTHAKVPEGFPPDIRRWRIKCEKTVVFSNEVLSATVRWLTH